MTNSVLSFLTALAVVLFPALAFASGGEAKAWWENLIPIGLLLAVVAVVIRRLPKVNLGHSPAYIRRRVMNWLPVGLTYAFLYMGRYNLNEAKRAIGGGEAIDNAQFGWIFGAGTFVYGISFLLNGPLTDRYGGRRTILVSAVGAAVCNLLMGTATMLYNHGNLPVSLAWAIGVLYVVNMYFQSFGAVSIVKINAPWFHVRERGVFGAIFGILISLGVYFAYDWSDLIVAHMPVHWVFMMPGLILLVFAVIVAVMVEETPGLAGFENFNTGDATSGDTGPPASAVQIFGKMLKNPIILTIAGVEFCSGFMRQAIMQIFPLYAKAVGIAGGFVMTNWGLLLCCAGILGGVLAGVISDHVFHSRRGPVAAVLYAGMLAGSAVLVGLIRSPALGWMAIAISLCVIGVHGMLSGTASMDFGGTKNAGIAVGIIDGFVYGGSSLQSFIYARILPAGGDAAKDPANWHSWPVAMVPVAIVGLVLATRVWNAKPQPKAA